MMCCPQKECTDYRMVTKNSFHYWPKAFARPKKFLDPNIVKTAERIQRHSFEAFSGKFVLERVGMGLCPQPWTTMGSRYAAIPAQNMYSCPKFLCNSYNFAWLILDWLWNLKNSCFLNLKGGGPFSQPQFGVSFAWMSSCRHYKMCETLLLIYFNITSTIFALLGAL